MTSTSTSGRSSSRTGWSVHLRLTVAWLIVNVAVAKSTANDSHFFNGTDAGVVSDADHSSNSSSSNFTSAAGGLVIDELQLVKVIVLVVVVAILLLSACTFILRTFSIFSANKKDEQ